MSPLVAEIQVETASYPPYVKPPGSSNTLFLAGAGFRGIEIHGRFVKVTALGYYMEDGAVPFLAAKWKGKSAEELAESAEFIDDILAAPFERFLRGAYFVPLAGPQYTEKVMGNCVAFLKSIGKFTEAEADAVEKFHEAFKDETFAPGSFVLFTQSPDGSITIGFSKDGTIPETGRAVITNKALSDAILESIIGLKGVSPATRESIAERMAGLMGGCEDGKVVDSNETNGKTEQVVVTLKGGSVQVV